MPEMTKGRVLFENGSKHFLPALPMHKIERNTLGLEAKIDEWCAINDIGELAKIELKRLLGLAFPRNPMDSPLSPIG